MASVALSPVFNEAQYFDNNGKPLNGGKIFTYLAGSTSTQVTTYTTQDGNVPNSNPIVLDSSGRPPYAIWLDTSVAYHIVLTAADGITVLDEIDDIIGVGTTSVPALGTPLHDMDGIVLGFTTGFVPSNASINSYESCDLDEYNSFAGWFSAYSANGMTQIFTDPNNITIGYGFPPA
jgi:hypothetical protein